MKKLLSVLLVIALSVAPLGALSGCTKYDEVLKLYSQGEYMDELNVFPAFQKFYKEKTGKNIKVTMEPFEDNEEMLSQVEVGKVDYDLICPSDYMVQKMIRLGLVLPIDPGYVDVATEFKPEYVEMTRQFDPELKYSVPFMYGTFGLMYNIEKTNGKKLDSWSSIFTDEFSGQVYTKKSKRDAFMAAAIYNNTAMLSDLSDGFTKNNTAAYQEKIQGLFNNTDTAYVDETVARIKDQRKYIMKYDEEGGKTDMYENKATAGLFWSCDAGYVMTDNADEETLGNTKLWYDIPKEGGNVYLDSFVINKYAKNKTAAQYFLQFLCTQEIAVINSHYIGAISPVKSAYDELLEEYTNAAIGEEGSVFEHAPSQEWKDMYLNMMFPSTETLNRCGSMRDYDTFEESIMTKIDTAMA